jgi:hypothetical protein
MSAARTFVLIAAAALLSSCVSHRSFRNIGGKSVFDNNEVDVPARLISCGITRGFPVLVEVFVTRAGTVDLVIAPAGVDQFLADAAVASARTCGFRPAQNNGEAVAVRLRTRVLVDPTFGP